MSELHALPVNDLIDHEEDDDASRRDRRRALPCKRAPRTSQRRRLVGGRFVGGSVVVTRSARPHPARIQLFAAAHTISEFAEYHGCSMDWASRALAGRFSASARFRRDLSEFLGVPEDDLFPLEDEPR